MTDTPSPVATAGLRGLTLFTLRGIDVRLDYSWFLIFALILFSLSAGYFPGSYPDRSVFAYWGAGLIATLLFFGSIIAHEFSHALAAQFSGIRVPSITLFLFGGVSALEEETNSPATELRVAIVGPLTSFALAAVFWGVYRALPGDGLGLGAGVVRYLAFINAALGVFNLLPGLPLDGGRVLRAIAWWRTGSQRRGTRIAANAGKGIAIGLMLLGALQIFGGSLLGGIWFVLIGLFLRATAEAGYQNLVLVETLEDMTVADVAIQEPVHVSPELTLQELIEDYILRFGYRAFPVVKDGAVLGLVTIAAVRDLPADERARIRVADRMTPLDDRLRVAPDAPLAQALKQLSAAPGQRLLVIQDSRLVGLLTKDGLNKFMELRRVLDAA